MVREWSRGPSYHREKLSVVAIGYLEKEGWSLVGSIGIERSIEVYKRE